MTTSPMMTMFPIQFPSIPNSNYYAKSDSLNIPLYYSSIRPWPVLVVIIGSRTAPPTSRSVLFVLHSEKVHWFPIIQRVNRIRRKPIGMIMQFVLFVEWIGFKDFGYMNSPSLCNAICPPHITLSILCITLPSVHPSLIFSHKTNTGRRTGNDNKINQTKL